MKRKGCACIAFTDQGESLAKRLAADLGGEADRAGKTISLQVWTERAFRENEALIFIGAAGIAVRAIAPHLVSKAEDPAVLVVDEFGQAVIPLLSGHLGGANAMAHRIAWLIGGRAVITTATDLNRAFAVDLWAKKQNMAVRQPGRIKQISGAVLQGACVSVECPWEITGVSPEQVRLDAPGDVVIDYRPHGGSALQLVPRVLVLGIGCRRGTTEEKLQSEFKAFCEKRSILADAVCEAASIDRKASEPGLLQFVKAHGWQFTVYPADELRAVEGSISPSGFVEKTVGVDNVCERAALRLSRGKLAEAKYAENGITFALAEIPRRYDWSW